MAHLLYQDLSFTGGERPHPLHALHAFAAKFPAQLPCCFIEGTIGAGRDGAGPHGRFRFHPVGRVAGWAVKWWVAQTWTRWLARQCRAKTDVGQSKDW